MIRKLNQELNAILSKASLQQKTIPPKKSIDSTIRVLTSEIANNEKILERQSGELKKVKGKAGIIKDEDYQIEIDR